MTIKSSRSGYGPIALTLHWINAMFVIILLFTGISLNIVSTDLKTLILQIHIGCGLIAFLLVTFRIIWAVFDVKPEPPSKLSPFRLFVFKAIHWFTYIGLFALIASGIGILISSSVGWSLIEIRSDMIARNLPPISIHGLMFKILILLMMLHIGGVLSYQLFKADVLHRMGFKWFKRDN